MIATTPTQAIGRSLQIQLSRFASRPDINIILDAIMAPFMVLYFVGGYRMLLDAACLSDGDPSALLSSRNIPSGYPCTEPAYVRTIYLTMRLPSSIVEYGSLMHPITGSHPHEICAMTLMVCYTLMLALMFLAPSWYLRGGRGWLLLMGTVQITLVSYATTWTHPLAPVSEFWTVNQLSMKGLRLVVQHVVGRVSCFSGTQSVLTQWGVTVTGNPCERQPRLLQQLSRNK